MGILLVWFVVIMNERDVIVRVELTSDICEGEPARLDKMKESLGAQ
jgi:hypothetical protein